jgi:hypothetical protein
MKKIIFLGIILIYIAFLSSCVNDDCKDASADARTYEKDTALLYLWKFTDSSNFNKYYYKDRTFIRYDNDGNYYYGETAESIYIRPGIWFTENSFIKTLICHYGVPDIYSSYKYEIKNDTLILYTRFATEEYELFGTYVKVKNNK